MNERRTDETRRCFLNKLDESVNVDVSDWEADFLNSTKDWRKFTEKQRMAIDRMMEKYGHKV